MGKMVFPEYLSWIGSIVAMIAFVRGILPRHYADYITDRFMHILSPYAYFLVHAVDGGHLNELHHSVQLYLGSLTSERALVSNIAIRRNAKKFTFGMASNQRIRDTFNGVTVEWQCKATERRSGPARFGDGDDGSLFELRVWRAYKDFLLEAYISHITEKAEELKRTNRQLRLYSNRRMTGYAGRSGRGWDYIPFRHPATFDTIAINPELKLSILKDLDQFVKGEEFYKRIGKAWKRGYLLYGPPGTGKTSIVAAMAHQLKYDIYDLELTEVHSNAELRNLLVYTESKSIVVIEDIDCSMDLAAQRKRKSPPRRIKVVQDADEERGIKAEPEDDPTNTMTLSGLLNFLDGLWSCCEDERIFVFTTNYVNKLDEALLRSGRMDMHISLSYIEFPAFKELAENFLQIKHHDRFFEVEKLLNDGSCIAPSEVAEILMRNRDDADAAMEQLVQSLRERKSNPPPRPSPPGADLPPPPPEPKAAGSTAEETGHSVSGDKQPPEKYTAQP